MSEEVDIRPALPDYLELYKESNSEIKDLFEELETNPKVNYDTLNIYNVPLLFELDFHTVIAMFLLFFENDLPFDLKDKDSAIEYFLNPCDLTHLILASFSKSIEQEEKNYKNQKEFKEDLLVLLSMLMNLLIALGSNMKAIAIYGFTNSICELIAKARDENDLESLFKAISVDRSCLSTPTAQKLILKANMSDDNEFFNKLSMAVKGSRPRNSKPELNDTRLLDAVIQSWKDKKKITANEVCHIFIDELKIYPSTGKDDYAGLTRLLQRLKKRK